MLFDARIQHVLSHPTMGHLFFRRGRILLVPLLRMCSFVPKVCARFEVDGLLRRSDSLVKSTHIRLERRRFRHAAIEELRTEVAVSLQHTFNIECNVRSVNHKKCFQV